MPARSRNLVLVSASSLLLVDLDTKRVVPLDTNLPECYGVSWFPHDPDLVLAHSAIDSSLLVDLASYVQSEVGFLSHASHRTPPYLSQPHQILCASDGRVVCANTGRNAISVVDFKRPGHIQEARISSVRWDRLTLDDTPGDHLNSVFEKDGHLFVIAHRFRKGSQLVTFTYPQLELVNIENITSRAGLHNIWVTSEGEQISCHSEAGALIELREGRVLWESGSIVYTRGLAACTDYVVIGESRRAERDVRRNSMSGLWILDRKTWRALDYIALGPYGGVKDVRLLNVADEAHHGHVFAGAAALAGLDAHEKERKRRLQATERATQSRTLWRGFQPVFGIPQAGADGDLSADSQDLCLIIMQPSSPVPTTGWDGQATAFRYAINPLAADSHVSFVVYRGLGADTDMHALLISASSRERATLRHWLHDGNGWSLQSESGHAGDLPLEGTLQVSADSSGVACAVDGKTVLRLPVERFPWRDGIAGIRWLGATIAPSK